MEHFGPFVNRSGLDRHGLSGMRRVYWNLPAARLYEQALSRGEAILSADGPLAAETGRRTGRSPNDKFIVREPSSEGDIWWGEVNRGVDREVFDRLEARAREWVKDRDLFVFNGYAGADPRYRMSVRVINQYAWHNLFAQNMFVRETDGSVLETFEPEFTVLCLPDLKAEGEIDGVNSEAFVLVDLDRHLVLIGGMRYAGEIKKSIFSVMNYYLPKKDVLSMHCSANYGQGKGDVALFFGLSGTGKTTLSADSSRTLIGDDEHGWSDDGVFNIEGGCYAKVIRLDPEGEPEIYATTQRFGTILENVVLDSETRRVNLDDDSKTENTRASYPIEQISNADLEGCAGHPKNVVFLTCDAFGVLPPISLLSEEQAMYHFLSGYTAKVAGTEAGVTEPTATFSACFGAPFMPLHPGVYAEMLGEKLRRHNARVWLINTGWTGGPFGVGKRMKLTYTRRMVQAALEGRLQDAETRTDPIFGVSVPLSIDGVPDQVLDPRASWADPQAYDLQAQRLAEMFEKNFEKYADGVNQAVIDAGPRCAKSA